MLLTSVHEVLMRPAQDLPHISQAAHCAESGGRQGAEESCGLQDFAEIPFNSLEVSGALYDTRPTFSLVWISTQPPPPPPSNTIAI